MRNEMKVKEKNKIEKSEENAETRMAVYIYIYIVYCHLENKNSNLQNAIYSYEKCNYVLGFIKLNSKIRDRTILLNVNNGFRNINSCKYRSIFLCFVIKIFKKFYNLKSIENTRLLNKNRMTCDKLAY